MKKYRCASVKRDQLHDFLDELRLSHDAAEIEDFISEEEEPGHNKDKLERNILGIQIICRMHVPDEKASADLKLAHQKLRVKRSVHARDLGQRVFELMDTAE